MATAFSAGVSKMAVASLRCCKATMHWRNATSKRRACHWSNRTRIWRWIRSTTSPSIAMHAGDIESPRSFLDACLARCDEFEQPWWTATALVNLGIAHGVDGDLQQAGELLSHALALFQRLGDAWAMSICLSNLANVAALQHDVARQTRLLLDALRVFVAFGDLWGVSDGLRDIGEVALIAGNTLRSPVVGDGHSAARNDSARQSSASISSWRTRHYSDSASTWILQSSRYAGPRARPWTSRTRL